MKRGRSRNQQCTSPWNESNQEKRKEAIRLRNTDIRHDIGIMLILDLIVESKMLWYGQVKRMEEERYTRRMLEWTPDGRTPTERHCMRWIKTLKRHWKGGTLVWEKCNMKQPTKTSVCKNLVESFRCEGFLYQAQGEKGGGKIVWQCPIC